MTFVHGSRVILISVVLVFLIISLFLGNKIIEKKMELKKNVEEYELTTEELCKQNQEVIKENNL